jgi:hypothetical protein
MASLNAAIVRQRPHYAPIGAHMLPQHATRFGHHFLAAVCYATFAVSDKTATNGRPSRSKPRQPTSTCQHNLKHTMATPPGSPPGAVDLFDPSVPFKGVVVCCTSIPPEQRVRCRPLIPCLQVTLLISFN